MIDDKAFEVAVARVLVARGLTDAEAAIAAGMEPDGLVAIRQYGSPRLGTLNRLASAWGCAVADLLDPDSAVGAYGGPPDLISSVGLALEAKGWTWNDLAGHRGVSRGALVTALSGANIQGRTLREIAESLGVRPRWLLTTRRGPS